MANVTETAEAQPDAIVARDAGKFHLFFYFYPLSTHSFSGTDSVNLVAAPCEPGKFGCTEPPREKRQTCHPGHECKPPKDIELEAQADTVEKRGGPIGIICYPWMACWKHGPPEVIKQLEAEAGTVEKRQGLIGFQCYPWMTCWPHVTEAEKQGT